MNCSLFFLSLLLLTVAVSLDSFGLGVSYGLSRIHVPFSAIWIIMICSGVIVFISMMAGNLLSSLFTPEVAKIIGGLILIFIGLFNLINVVRSKKKGTSMKKPSKPYQPEEKQWKIHLRKLGIIITILKKLEEADLDHSGVISKNEAFLLGLALSLDALSVGLGAAMLGYPPILCALFVAFMSGLGITIGKKLGYILSQKRLLQKLLWLPPFILISIGLASLL